MKKQTAVQWLLSRIPDVDKVAIKGLSQIEREQALQMEREQIIDFTIELLDGDNIHTLKSRKELVAHIKMQHELTFKP